MSKEFILEQARQSILKCDPKKAIEIARQALAEGLDPVEVLSEGFSDGIRMVGDLFGRGELFLPELISASQVMKEASIVLEEAIEANMRKNKGKMIIATVEGDVHDIGKGIVISLIKSQGIEVIDLGREIPVSTIIEKAVEHDVNIIGTSALLTTTMPEQKKLEAVLRKEGLRDRFKTMVGGAPCTQRWADRIGADAYGEDAAEAVTKALALLG